MALQGSGQIKLSDIATEFGDTIPYSMSEYYRDAGKVPGVNTNVPLAGAIRFGQFYGAVNELVIQATSQASLNAQTLFGPEWSNAIPKRLIVPAGVTIGPMTIPTGLGGTLVVQNEGEIQGLGGAANGGAGGHAITASSSFTLENTGAVRGGGGGGGKGGNGGQGVFTSTVSQGPIFAFGSYQWSVPSNSPYGLWAGSQVFAVGGAASLTSYTVGSIKYYRGAFQYNSDGGDTPNYAISRTYPVNNYTSGGAGGNGGVGRGYGQAPASGLGGSAGGTNAGVGGTGGSGAEWGANGNTGNNGANGNYTGGLAGSAGGAAGRAVQMLAGTLTLNNNGTINGATA